MLSDRHCQLLTAYIDGELDAHQRQAVERLLAKSPDARAMLEKLEADSKELRKLPVKAAPETLADLVLETLSGHEQIPEAGPALPAGPPVRPFQEPGTRSIPPWLGLAVAACVLIAVGIATYFLVGGLLSKPEDNANRPAPRQPNADRPAAKGGAVDGDPFHRDMMGNAVRQFGADVPDNERGFHFRLANFQEPAVQRRLANELELHASFWVDVPVADPARAIEHLSDAFQRNGIRCVMDGARASLKKQNKCHYMLYAENLKHDELTEILRNAATPSKGQTASPLDLLRINFMEARDHEELAKRMGMKPGELAPAKVGKFEDNPPLQPGGGIAKNGGKVPPPERLAIVFAVGDGSNPIPRADLKQFVDSRRPLRPGTVQFVVEFRETSK
jgi:hypothetical protein